MKPADVGQCSCCINIDKNNYSEETELYANPSLTLARNLTLSTGERSSGHFASSRCYDTTIFNFAKINSPKIRGGNQSLNQNSIWDGKSQLHEIDA